MQDTYLLPEALRKPFQAVLFDLDGTLIDSEEVHYEAFTKAMEQYGYDFKAMSEEIQYQGSFRRMFMDIAKKNEFDEDEFNKIYNRKMEITLQTPATSVDMVEGVLSFLELLKERGIPMSVVTNSDRAYADYALDGHGLTEYFEDVITATEMTNIKPAPEGYLTAAKLLEKDPTNCLVFENTDAGINAGKDAGCAVVAIHGTDVQGFSTYERADHTVDNFGDASINDIEFVSHV